MLPFLIIQRCTLMSTAESGQSYALTCPAFLVDSIHGGHQITESGVMLVLNLVILYLDLK